MTQQETIVDLKSVADRATGREFTRLNFQYGIHKNGFVTAKIVPRISTTLENKGINTREQRDSCPNRFLIGQTN